MPSRLAPPRDRPSVPVRPRLRPQKRSARRALPDRGANSRAPGSLPNSPPSGAQSVSPCAKYHSRGDKSPMNAGNASVCWAKVRLVGALNGWRSDEREASGRPVTRWSAGHQATVIEQESASAARWPRNSPYRLAGFSQGKARRRHAPPPPAPESFEHKGVSRPFGALQHHLRAVPRLAT